jgi:serine/threonine protein kinase
MGTGDNAPKTPNTDNQETSVLGKEASTSAGTLLNNRYLLIRQLNAGGFGTVHLAHDQQMHGRPVVVKIQINQRVDDPWFERKFSEEVRALSMLDHPGVVVAFDSGRTPDGMPFLVMQYVEGVTLRAAMSPEGMPLARAAGILKQLGHALAAAHEKGIWHRDLKPENIMLQPSGGSDDRVRLIDFGIATVADVKSKYQTSTRVAGSVLYMAPEQTIGQPTALTDIYAMGLIAYEMLTGRRPFPAENTIQMIAMQQQPVRVKPSDLRPSLPFAAEQLILRSLEAEPAKRPENARTFGDRLHDALLGSAAHTFAQTAYTPPPLPPPPPTAHFTTPPVNVAVPSAPRKKKGRGKAFWAVIGGLVLFWNLSKDWRKPHSPVVKVSKTLHAEVGPDGDKPSKTPFSEDAIELAFWNSVKDSAEPRLYNEYLAQYPDGRFASLAKTKIELLGGKEIPRAAAPAGSEDDELAFWRTLKSEDGPQRYRDYLKKYPNGMFASVARLILVSLEKAAVVSPEPAPMADPTEPNFRKQLPPPRPAVDLASYRGPTEGEIQWSGRVLNNTGLMIQAGEANTGTISGDLPRVPVKIELAGTQATAITIPAARNQWDHLGVRNLSGKPMRSLVIRWKVIKPGS